jgi:hypothetical protein
MRSSAARACSLSGNGFAVTRDDDFLAFFDPVQEHPEFVFRFKGSDFHDSPLQPV